MKGYRSCWLFTATIGIILMTPTTMANSEDDTTDLQAVNGPIISPMNDKKEIILQKGENFTIRCKGKRPLHIKQQEIPEDVVGNFSTKLVDETPTDDEYQFGKALKLYNVDQYAVGYYACFDDTVNGNAILANIMEEPTDTSHVSYIYIYVNGTDVLFAPLSEFGTVINGSNVFLQCRPTMPDIKMSLSMPQTDETPDIIKYSPKIGFVVRTYNLKYQCNGRKGSQISSKPLGIRQGYTDVPNINIDKGSIDFLEGETFSLNCSVEYQHNSPLALFWLLPRNYSKETDMILTNEKYVKPGENVYHTIQIVNASKDDEGTYTCKLNVGVTNGRRKTASKTARKVLTEPYIRLKTGKKNDLMETFVKNPRIRVEVEAYPKPTFTFRRNGQPLDLSNPKYITDVSKLTGDVSLMILNSTVEDSANYTFIADNGYVKKSINYEFRKISYPEVRILPTTNMIYHEKNQIKTLRCIVTGYPLPTIKWVYTTDKGDARVQSKDEKMAVYKIESSVEINPTESGNLSCIAYSGKDKTINATRQIRLFDVAHGFGILDNYTWYPENFNVSIECRASIYDFDNVTWRSGNGDELLSNVKYSSTKLSHVAKLKINRITVGQAGKYTCVGLKSNGSEEHQSVNIEVEAQREPTIIEPIEDKDEIVEKFQPVDISCIAEAVPPPTISWYKDDIILMNDTEGIRIINKLNHTVASSTIVISGMKIEYVGKYECKAISAGFFNNRIINLKVPDQIPYKTTIISVVAAVILALIVLVMYLTWKIKKEKKFRKEMAAAGLLYFKEGVTKSLNPDLAIDEQAELLPYDEKFEFPAEKLILGKQLGFGAFGVVYKAEARGIINAEETTPVAVKMVKKTADNMYIKALASELKIMVHLGKHINIVNLLGACTKNVGKRELIVIVEYCKFGNLHNYLQKHREVFIDQLTDNQEKNLGKVNRGYSCSSGSSGMNSDYFGIHNTQVTDNTILNSANTTRSVRKESESGYLQPQWGTNYESDYSFDGRNPRPLCSRDLLAWAFQVARGMEYLANRKVLHGDLAARNILLAEDNIVKICDFGLSRSIFKNDEYQKKENSPLPVKWLAIECMTDRIFSTQSDVWSFGIVLWEMFTLAKTPYPNMSPPHLLQWLTSGNRLEKPQHADDRLYDVMLRCWEHKPSARPSFSHLQELLGSFLEDNVRNHYVDLNSAFMDTNVKPEGEDYLAMVSAPDYNNMVTPSPQYVNEEKSFFPPTPSQVPLDEEGYLQMTPVNPSIFSPRTQSTKFDFDMKKLDPRVAETRGGSELTPMLTLNNLPARSGSDSDHEGGHSPYLNMCPRIVEETDDVFKPNDKNEKNIQNSAVSNPTYISLDLDIEKKPQDIISYVNVPNGLVK